MSLLSRSALEAFGCPRRYKAIHLDGVVDSGPEAVRGQIFHDAAARYIGKLVMARATEDLDAARTALREAVLAHPASEPIISDVEYCFWKWAERFRMDHEAFLLAEERQNDGEFSWMPDYVQAFPDLLEIKDWKTYYVALTEAQAAADFQPRFYLWQAMHMWPGFSAYRFTFVFVRLGVEVSVTLSQAELQAFGDRVRLIAEAIQQARARDEWPALPGDHCRYCRIECPIADHPERALMRVTTPEEASEAFGRYLALQRQATNLKEAVSAFAAIHGPVECRGATGQYDLTTQRTWPLFKVLEVLTAHGVMEPSFSVSATTLQTYLKTKKHAAIGRDLEPLAFTKHGNRFNVKYRQPDKHADPVQTEEAAD